MLRNKYILKYKSSENPSQILLENINYIEHNDNRQLYLERPLEPSQIRKISKEKIFPFIDNIMCNKKINNLLYSSNAKKMALYYIKQKKFLLTQHIPLQIESDNIFRKKKISLNERIKREGILEDIKENIEIYRKNQKRYLTQIMEKDNEFLDSQPKVDKKIKKYDSKSVNEIILKGYKRAFDKCLNDSLTKENFQIIDLNTNDVYGRLYNNYSSTIYNDKNNKKILKRNSLFKKRLSRNSKNNSISELNTNISVPKKIMNFKLNSNISNIENALNQFNATISKKQIRRCCSVISGGPKKLRIKKARNSLKEKIKQKYNHKILSYKTNGDKNDLSLYYTMVAEDPLMKKYKILNKNYRDKNNNTSLQIAVKKNSINMVKYFLNKKHKNINSRNNKGQTALHLACSTGNKNMINLLIKNGANVSAKDFSGNKPFDYLSSERSKIS